MNLTDLTDVHNVLLFLINILNKQNGSTIALYFDLCLLTNTEKAFASWQSAKQSIPISTAATATVLFLTAYVK